MVITVVRFAALKPLSGSERQRLEVGSAIMNLLWQAGTDTGIFSLEEVRERGRCLLVANAMLAVLHHLGYPDTVVHVMPLDRNDRWYELWQTLEKLGGFESWPTAAEVGPWLAGTVVPQLEWLLGARGQGQRGRRKDGEGRRG